MGNKHGHKMDRKTSAAMAESTNFNEQEVVSLHGYFNNIAKNKVKNETVIDRKIFKDALGLKESLFINRMFLMFDTGMSSFLCSPALRLRRSCLVL